MPWPKMLDMKPARQYFSERGLAVSKKTYEESYQEIEEMCEELKNATINVWHGRARDSDREAYEAYFNAHKVIRRFEEMLDEIVAD